LNQNVRTFSCEFTEDSLKYEIPYFQVFLNEEDEGNSTQEFMESKKRKRETDQEEEKKKRKIIKEMNDLQRKQFELMRLLYFSFPISNDVILKNILQFISLDDILHSFIFFTCKNFYKYFNDSSFWKDYSINLWGENQFKKEFNNWKQYLFERGRHTVEASNQIQSFLSNPKSVEDIQFYVGAYQMSQPNCTYLKYFSNDNQLYCECLLWSLKFPKYVQLQFESSNGKIKLFLLDDVQIYLDDGSMDDYMVESARKSLEYPMLEDNESFLEFVNVDILKFNIQ
jgi:hypothetical protein